MLELTSLQAKVKLLDELSFLGSKDTEKEIELACVAFLRAIDYKVVKKPIFVTIKKLDELIDLFYNLLNYHHNDTCELVSNRQRDRKIFSSFIAYRQDELKCSFNNGLQDCANIIKALFIFESHLELTVPLGTWIFSSTKYKWLVDRVVGMLDGNMELLNQRTLERKIVEDEANSKEYTGFDFNKLRRLYGD